MINFFQIVLIIIKTKHDYYETGKEQDTGKKIHKNKTKLLLLWQKLNNKQNKLQEKRRKTKQYKKKSNNKDKRNTKEKLLPTIIT